MGPEQITDKFFLGTSAICTPLIKFIANLKEDSSYIFFTKQELFPFSNLSIRIKSLLAALYLKIVGFKNLTRLVFLTLLVINGDHLYLSSVNFCCAVIYKEGPPFYHGSYSVIVKMVRDDDLKEEDNLPTLTWTQIAGLNRLTEHVAKVSQLRSPIITIDR